MTEGDRASAGEGRGATVARGNPGGVTEGDRASVGEGRGATVAHGDLRRGTERGDRARARDRLPGVLGIARGMLPWCLVAGLGALGALLVTRYFDLVRGHEKIVWRSPRAVVLLAAAAFTGVVGFHLHRRRAAAMAFSQTQLVRRVGVAAWLSDFPGVLRVLAIAALTVALARPETYRTLKHEIDTIDIMLVVDMSKSMEETDLPRDRLDAAQRVIRRFLRRTAHDRIGLVVFGQETMLECPLTLDTKVLEQIVADLAIGDVRELGTAIGDGLGLALSQLRDDRRETGPEMAPAKSKVVILLSDGDSNWVTRFEPEEAARVAKDMGVKVYTILVGREESDLFGGMSVNPATLRSIAALTGGEFFRATDYESFDKGFQTVRSKLDTTKRVEIERIPDKQLFAPLALLGLLLLGIELVLSHTRLRRLP
ncbi:MAG TPA: VWA domain-containing protein [Kofleriaceae bacterium]|nr:VWA domain-containing protein [Kofleriaceae bacterium]